MARNAPSGRHVRFPTSPTSQRTASSSSQNPVTAPPTRQQRKRKKRRLAATDHQQLENTEPQLPAIPRWAPNPPPPLPLLPLLPPPPMYIAPPVAHYQITQPYHIPYYPPPPGTVPWRPPPPTYQERSYSTDAPDQRGRVETRWDQEVSDRRSHNCPPYQERSYNSYAPGQNTHIESRWDQQQREVSDRRSHHQPPRPPPRLQEDRDDRGRTLRAPSPQSRRSRTPPSAPIPSPEYLSKCAEPPSLLSTPRELLVVLDLNGTLLHRPKSVKRYAASRNPVLRPGLYAFLEYLFANHQVMIWTSARPENARSMCEAAFLEEQRDRLLAVWARDTLGLTEAQYNGKVQVYKRLDRVWKGEFMVHHPDLDKDVVFDQTNTVLFDDSTEKAASCPWNLVNLPEFKGGEGVSKKSKAKAHAQEETVLKICVEYLEALKMQSNVSSYMSRRPFGTWKTVWTPMEMVKLEEET